MGRLPSTNFRTTGLGPTVLGEPSVAWYVMEDTTVVTLGGMISLC